MNRLYQIFAAILYGVLFFALYPWYQYVLDIDAISYIHVAERYSSGSFFNAVNGYWSPLVSWILIPFINAGFDALTSAKHINGLLGLLTLFTSYSLMDKFAIHKTFYKILPFIFCVLFTAYSFYELCADLLQLLLLLQYLNFIFSKNFIHNNYKIAGAAILAALCYYAKAYSFPFFLLHFSITVFVLLRRNNTTSFSRIFITKTAIAFITFFLLVTPYLVLLYQKYGSFRINNAGKLNISWFLSPGISDHRKMVAIPPYADATSYWDEPTYTQEKFVGPFTSIKFFFKEIKLTIGNAIKFSGLLNLISIFSFLILTAFIIYLYRKRKDSESNEWLLFLTTVLYPSGYLLIFIEWRYIWLLPITLLLMMAIVLSYLYKQGYLTHRRYLVIALLVAASFLVHPVNEMQDLRYNNKDVFEMAAAFRKNGIRGNIFLNYKSFTPYGKTVVLSYLTQSKLYGPVTLDYTFEELMQSARIHNINYYLYFYTYPSEKEMFMQSTYAKAGVRIYDQLYPGLIVVQLK